MKQFLALIQTEYKSHRKIEKTNPTFFDKLVKILSIVLLYVLILTVITTVFYYVIKLCIQSSLDYDFLTLFTLLMQVFLIVSSVVAITKSLLSANANKQILTLPIPIIKVFFAKVSFVYVQQLLLSLLLCVPVFTTFGILTSQSASFYFMIIPSTVLLGIVPICLSVFLSIPFSFVIRFLQRKFVIQLIVYSILIVLCFYVYIDVLKFLLQLFSSTNYTNILTYELVTKIQSVSSLLVGQVLIKNLLISHQFVKSLIIICSLSAAFVYFIYLFGKFSYFNVMRKTIMQELTFDKKQSKIKKSSIITLFMSKEIKSIFRSTNYSFSFLTVAFTTPIMVFFCNSIVSQIGVVNVGSIIFPALSFLIILLFMTLAISFVATAITREGKDFATTKVIPVSAKQQVKAKLYLYLIIELPVVFISAFVLHFAGFLNLVDTFVISVAVCINVFANMCSAFKIDLKTPQFSYLTNNEVIQNNANISKALSICLSIGLLIGVTSIVLIFSIPKIYWYLIIIAFGIIYSIVTLIKFFKNIERDYQNIEY